MDQFLTYTVAGLVAAGIFAVAASGLVVTYTTSGIFNFAHGAVGMMAAFVYWQLHVDWGMPGWLTIALVLLVIAPIFGGLLDLVIMRGLEGTSEVTKTVVTVGVFATLLALAPVIWPTGSPRSVQPFFSGQNVEIFGVNVTYHQIVVIAVAIAVAIGLRLLLFNTRAGVSMRAVVSNRSLVELNGGRPGRSSALSWALGSSLASLAGILVAEKLGLEATALTLLVVNAFAAAIVGRLTSLPMTFVGAIILGLLSAYATPYLPKEDPSWLPTGINLFTPLGLAVPMIMLFVTLLLLPQAPLRVHGLLRSRERIMRPTLKTSLTAAVALVVGTFILSRLLTEGNSIAWGEAFAYGLIMLSLVPLTGFGGQISLAQISFAGLGAVFMATWGTDGSLLGIVAAIGIPAVVGAVVALPALRLRGIYLALSTFAFAVFMDSVVFNQQRVFPAGSLSVPRPEILGLSFNSNTSYLVFLSVVFALVGLFVVWLRLGRFGRRLQAMKDSPAACATLGLNLTITKLQVFALSAAIAGLGGAMLTSMSGTAFVFSFNAMQGLPILLLAVAGGIAMVSGALVGGAILALLPVLSEAVPALSTLFLVGPGLIGITLGRNPNGIANITVNKVKDFFDKASYTRRGEKDDRSSFLPGGPRYDVENLGITRPFTDDDLTRIDRALALSEREVAGSGAA